MPKQGSKIAQGFRANQEKVDDVTQRAIEQLWDRYFQIGTARASWARMRPSVMKLTVTGYIASGREGQRYYSAARLAAGLPARKPVAAPVLTAAHIGAVIDPAGLGMFLHMVKGGARMIDAANAGKSSLSSAVGRLVLSGGRDTVTAASIADPDALGWVRITGGTCDYCEALAAAGIFDDAADDFSAHDDCMCNAEPKFSGSSSQAAVLQSAKPAEEGTQAAMGRSPLERAIREVASKAKDSVSDEGDIPSSPVSSLSVQDRRLAQYRARLRKKGTKDVRIESGVAGSGQHPKR